MTKPPDLSEFIKYSQPRRRPCPIRPAVDSLTDIEQAQFAAALATDPGIITNGAIVRWLDSRGHVVSNNAVVHHRKGSCACGHDR